MKKLLISVLLALLMGAPLVLSSPASAATHATYALGSAKKCRVSFVKHTETRVVSEKVKVTVKGKTVEKSKKVKQRYVACVYVAPKPVPPSVITPTPTPPATTPTAKADPPTDVVVTPSANPAYLTDGSVTVTYTVTVASVAIPQTTGQIEVSDNGSVICGPANGTYNSDGTYSLTCIATYTQAETDTIVGIFTGDSEFAQSAGSVTETIDATAPDDDVSPGGGGGSLGGGGGGSTPPPSYDLSVSLGGSPVQSNSDYLNVTYSATASATENSSPASSLPSGTLSFYGDDVLLCSDAVDGSTSTGNCAITWSTFGSHNVLVTYTDTNGDAPATTGEQAQDVEPPSLTEQASWPTDSPTIDAIVSQDETTAAVTLTDSDYEGVASLTIDDNNGDSCAASVSGTTASCTMDLSALPTSFTADYPGATTDSTQAVSPNGTQDVTTDWAATDYVIPGADTMITEPTMTDVSDTIDSIQSYAEFTNPCGTTANPEDDECVEMGVTWSAVPAAGTLTLTATAGSMTAQCSLTIASATTCYALFGAGVPNLNSGDWSITASYSGYDTGGYNATDYQATSEDYTMDVVTMTSWYDYDGSWAVNAPVYSEGRVHVMADLCETCVFRPGNLMHLQRGRVAQMVREAKANESAIACHSTLYGQRDQEAVCRGYFDRYGSDVVTLRLAMMMGVIEEVPA